MNTELHQNQTFLKDLENWDRKTFEMHLKVQVSNTVAMNYDLKQTEKEKTDYIKQYLLTNYFPECFSMKITEHRIDKFERLSTLLQCKVEFNTEEYKDCVGIYMRHFLMNPKWRVVELKPMKTRWHE